MERYKINDTVLYGFDGVCTVTDITKKTVCGKEYSYYVLKPVSTDRSTFFVPTENEKSVAKLKRVLSEKEIYQLIRSMPKGDTIWIDNENLRTERYKQIIAGNDRQQLVALIRTLYFKKCELEEKGKKLHKWDETYMKEAEKLLYEEFSLVLNLK